ncbi:MAG: FadR family transcriptional regulator [Deltaproteobacteria bacterium]|nr:FadR family transcriptional regulator [Deltaproteobacteria bacterium]
MNYKPIKRKSTVELVRGEILKSIESGQLKPGDKLPTEHQLCKMFGVGRSTVREAISNLSILGYLQSIQGKGCYVREGLDPDSATRIALHDIQSAANIIDLIEIREILECNAVRLAAQRANAEDVARIQEAFTEMKAAGEKLNRFTAQDFKFHIALARASGNRIVVEMMRQIVEKVHLEYIKFRPDSLFQREEAVLTAKRIVDFVLHKDAEKAADAMRAHLNLVTTELNRKLPDIKWINRSN